MQYFVSMFWVSLVFGWLILKEIFHIFNGPDVSYEYTYDDTRTRAGRKHGNILINSLRKFTAWLTAVEVPGDVEVCGEGAVAPSAHAAPHAQGRGEDAHARQEKGETDSHSLKGTVHQWRPKSYGVWHVSWFSVSHSMLLKKWLLILGFKIFIMLAGNIQGDSPGR